MSIEKHHIDSLFENGLEHLSVEPRQSSWSAISNRLDAIDIAATRRKLILRWTTFSAAMIAIAAYIFIKSCSVDGAPSNYVFAFRNHISESHLKYSSNSTSLQEHIINKSDKLETQPNNSLSLTYKSDNVRVNDEFIELGQNIDIVSDALAKSEITDQIIEESPIEDIANNSSDLASENNSYIEASVIQSADNQTYKTADIVVPQESLPDFPAQATIIDIPQTTENTLDSTNQEITSANQIPPIPFIATGLSIEFGFGPNYQVNNLPGTTIFDMPIVQSNANYLFPSGEMFLHLKYYYSNFYIKSGFQLSEFGQNSTFNITHEMHDTSGGYASYHLNRYWTYDTIGFFDDPFSPGVIYPILTPTYHIDTVGSQWNSRDEVYYTTSELKAINRFRYVETPLIVGYSFDYKRFLFSVGTGLSYGRMFDVSGKYYESGTIQDATTHQNPYNPYNFNYLAQIGLGYAISNSWNLVLQANYKTNISSIYKEQYFKDTRFQSFGATIGASFNIK